MLRVDPFTTYAYCCRICSLEFFTVFLLFLKVQWTNAKALRVCCNMVNKRFTDKIFKNSYNPSPLAFHFFITLCATEAIVLDPFLWPNHPGVFQTHQAAASSHLARSVSSSIVGRYRMQHLMCREEFCNLLHYHCVVILFAVPGELSFTVSWFMIGFN